MYTKSLVNELNIDENDSVEQIDGEELMDTDWIKEIKDKVKDDQIEFAIL